MSNLKQAGVANLLTILLLVVGLFAAVYAVQKTTNVLPFASSTNSSENLFSNPQEIEIKSNGNFGIQIHIEDETKIPGIKEFDALKPGWVRFEYKAGDTLPKLPKGVKKLVIFTHMSIPGDNPNKTNYYKWALKADWDAYTKDFVNALENFIRQNFDKVDAIEIGNEVDLCAHEIEENSGKDSDEEKFCPGVPVKVYPDLLKKSAAIIKQYNPNIKIIMGGLVTNDITWGDGGYLTKVIKADPSAFDQVDGIGLHPYGKTIDGWCSCSSDKTFPNGNPNTGEQYCTTNIDAGTGRDMCEDGILPWGSLDETVKKYKAIFPSHVKLWITEIGQGSNNSEWQKEYMKKAFDYLSNEAEVIIWYAFIDTMTGGDGRNNWGLYDKDLNIKPAGELFEKYSSLK